MSTSRGALLVAEKAWTSADLQPLRDTAVSSMAVTKRKFRNPDMKTVLRRNPGAVFSELAKLSDECLTLTQREAPTLRNAKRQG